jgi:hypothetical protein
MRPKFQKQSALKLAGRIIPRSGGYNTRDCRGIIIGYKIAQKSNRKPKGEEYHEIKHEGQDGRQVSPNEG